MYGVFDISYSMVLTTCFFILFFQKMTEKCFKKCVQSPGTSLSSSEQVRPNDHLNDNLYFVYKYKNNVL